MTEISVRFSYDYFYTYLEYCTCYQFYFLPYVCIFISNTFYFECNFLDIPEILETI